MTYVLSIDCGFPFVNLAFTSVVEISPSSSIMNIPVTSPSAAVFASKQFGLLKLNVATPDEPSFALVSLTSGTTFSSKPLTNWIDAASRDVDDDTAVRGLIDDGANAAASGVSARRLMSFIVQRDRCDI